MFFDPPRHEDLEYKWELPDLKDVEEWISRAPTVCDFSPGNIFPGVSTWNNSDIWICVNVQDDGPQYVDLHWIHFNRQTGSLGKIQQRFFLHNKAQWTGAVFTLTAKQDADYCPSCLVKLEWAAMALKCPQCWWVQP